MPSQASRQFRPLLSLGLLALGIGATATSAYFLDAAPVSGTTIGTVTPAAPVLSCGANGPQTTTITWTSVARASGYRLEYGPSGQTIEDVSAATLSKTFTNKTQGVLRVRTIYGGTWTSALSNPRSYESTGQGSCT